MLLDTRVSEQKGEGKHAGSALYGTLGQMGAKIYTGSQSTGARAPTRRCACLGWPWTRSCWAVPGSWFWTTPHSDRRGAR